MKNLLSAAVLIGGLSAVDLAHAACLYPIAPGKFPGTGATLEEMKVAKAAVVRYDADMKAYIVCIRAEHGQRLAEQSEITADRKAEMERRRIQKEDAALAEVQDVVGRFNEQLKAWQEKNDPGKKPS